ncbi:hypothetical protein [Mycolicibacterium parafortuitum]|uniref:Transmembrane protein n=1 Tax=Mycolicibacterium parafortuitum TaxID=39692 RepID=A0A375YCD5_MYCPF|nr:hypothetical protein [Mycolicibacterium parafortuitum]ORB30828.1 hypothetical protein BST38_08825 [Mycolicibacterium parafortuitum]SRX78739.1 hypothetical protein MPP7335_00468 [Mycolicibacterium parafortuitum]
MGRTAAVIWHASFSVAAGVLYFFFVLPRTPELLGETPHGLGTALRIVTGALIGLAALPVVFTLLRTRKPEFGTPQMALNLRTTSIVLHVVAGVLIVATAISEIWLSLDSAGQWLFGIYGAAAAIALLGMFAFYLAFVAELPPPPPKPVKVKERTSRRGRKQAGEGADETAETSVVEDSEAETSVVEDSVVESTESAEAEATDAGVEVDSAQNGVKAEDESDPNATEPDDGKLRNQRPNGKGTVLGRRRRTRGGVAVED